MCSKNHCRVFFCAFNCLENEFVRTFTSFNFSILSEIMMSSCSDISDIPSSIDSTADPINHIAFQDLSISQASTKAVIICLCVSMLNFQNVI